MWNSYLNQNDTNQDQLNRDRLKETNLSTVFLENNGNQLDHKRPKINNTVRETYDLTKSQELTEKRRNQELLRNELQKQIYDKGNFNENPRSSLNKNYLSENQIVHIDKPQGEFITKESANMTDGQRRSEKLRIQKQLRSELEKQISDKNFQKNKWDFANLQTQPEKPLLPIDHIDNEPKYTNNMKETMAYTKQDILKEKHQHMNELKASYDSQIREQHQKKFLEKNEGVHIHHKILEENQKHETSENETRIKHREYLKNELEKQISVKALQKELDKTKEKYLAQKVNEENQLINVRQSQFAHRNPQLRMSVEIRPAQNFANNEPVSNSMVINRENPNQIPQNMFQSTGNQIQNKQAEILVSDQNEIQQDHTQQIGINQTKPVYDSNDQQKNRQASKFYNVDEDHLLASMNTNPNMTDQAERERKYQKSLAIREALEEQIAENKSKKAHEKKQEMLEDEMEEVKIKLENTKDLLEKQALQASFDQLHNRGEATGNILKKNDEFSDQHHMQREILSEAVSAMTKKFRDEVSTMRTNMQDQNKLLEKEVDTLKNRAGNLKLQKDTIDMEMTTIQRGLMSQKNDNDDQLAFLYMALNKTNLPDRPEKKVYERMVPLEAVYKGSKGDPFMRMDELQWDSANNEVFNEDTFADIGSLNYMNKDRLGELNRLNDHVTDFQNPRLQLDSAMGDFLYNEDLRISGYHRKVKNAWDTEKQLIEGIESLVHGIKSYT